MLSRQITVIFVLLIAVVALADPPPGYYDTVEFTDQATLRSTLHDVIDGHTRYPYTSFSTDTWDILNHADEDPLDSSRILDVYQNRSFPKWSGGNNDYNREHTWPNSYGFPDDNSGNSPYTDCHHLMLCDIGYNGYRGSRIFDDCTSGCTPYATDSHDGLSGVNYTRDATPVGVWETWDHRKGDIARAMFYMDVRYEGDDGSEPDLILVDDPVLIVSCQTGDNEAVGYMGLLTTLLAWHEADPVDDKERTHNEVVYEYQHNRNPFVDHPEWVDLLFGGGLMSAPEMPMAIVLHGAAPNPFNPATSIGFTLDCPGFVALDVFGLDGRKVRSLVSGVTAAGYHDVVWRGRDDAGRVLSSGAYVVRLQGSGRVASGKVLLLQ